MNDEARDMLRLLDAHDNFGGIDRHFSTEERVRILARAVLRREIRYPENIAPGDVMARGMALQIALETGDRSTVERLGVKAKVR